MKFLLLLLIILSSLGCTPEPKTCWTTKECHCQMGKEVKK